MVLCATRHRGLGLALLVLAGSFTGTAIGAPPASLPTAGSAACEERPGDAAVTASILLKLAGHSRIDADEIEVLTVDGKVLLRGLVRSQAQKGLAGRLAGDTRGVLGVDNRLDVIDWAPITDIARDQAQARVQGREAAGIRSDAWISDTVATTLRASPGTGSCDIQVGSRAGVVTLEGPERSAAARDLAIELVQGVWGVRRVEATGLLVR